MTAVSALTRIASFRISPLTELHICRGSVLDFAHQRGAIVNAANPTCLGGGGVDGAITSAGGPTLHTHRMELPLLEGGIRCPTGSAKITGPGDYGSLRVPFVIHAVGPCYHEYDSLEDGDALLQSAYTASLDCAREAQLEAVAFSLLSAGIFRGDRSVKQVLSIGIESICDWIKNQGDSSTLSSVIMCGFNPHEVNTLVDICEDDLKLDISEHVEEEAENDDTQEGNNDATEDEEMKEKNQKEEEGEEQESAAKVVAEVDKDEEAVGDIQNETKESDADTEDDDADKEQDKATDQAKTNNKRSLDEV